MSAKSLFPALALATAAAALPAQADGLSQLAASAGFSAEEAAGLSLAEIAVAKFNRGSERDDRIVLVARSGRGGASQLAAVVGLSTAEAATMTLREVAVARFNRGASTNDAIIVVPPKGDAGLGARLQLAASAGLSPEQAATLSLDAIAAHAFNRGEAIQDQRRIVE